MRITSLHVKIFLGLFVFCSQVNAQISTREAPIGFKHNFSREQKTEIVMPAIDIAKLQAEDKKEEELGLPPRFGFVHSVNLNLLDAGYWHTLENGDKLCQLTIVCPDALSINLLYDTFWLPEGAKFFIYSNNRKHSIGAFTSQNNKGSRSDMRGFATGLVYGGQITLEYYVPNDVKEVGIISISGIVHGYRYILPEYGYEYGYGNVPGNDPSSYFGFKQSGSCQVNINCSEGNNWRKERRAVALMIVYGCRTCTGSLINNTNNDFKPYFLTAHHCLGNFNAETKPNLDSCIFYWNYELPPNSGDCNYDYFTPAEPLAFSTSGATVIANNSASDFALLKLTEDPKLLINYTPSFVPYYLGWDRTGNPGTGGVCIHHPKGDVKKIATYTITPTNSDCLTSPLNNTNYWKINWSRTANGFSVTETVSSGSALLNNNGHIIGQLQGYGGCPNPDCNNPAGDIGNYGKFHISWIGGGTDKTRLSNWLAPHTTTTTILNGIDACPNSVVYVTQNVTTNKTVTNNCGSINVQNGVEVKQGATLILEAEETTKIPGGFKVELGAGLKIQ